MGLFRSGMPGPMEPWMVRRGWDEQEVLRRLDEGSLEWYYNKILDMGYYKEPGADAMPDLWYNDGKPGIDNEIRLGLRENFKRMHRKKVFWSHWGWLITIFQFLAFLIILPIYCMGVGDAIHSMLGTGKYSKGDE